jgi:hypothetical protein
MEIRKYGERMNSPRLERRNLYLEIHPFTSLSDTTSTLQNLQKLWEFESPNLDPWYRYQQCQYCIRRAKYEIEQFSKGEWCWNRRFCLRHYLVEHLVDITLSYRDVIESNRTVFLDISPQSVLLLTGSHNYKYHVEVSRQYANVEVEYKGKKYTFRYNNHANSLPFASSYVVLLYVIRRVDTHFAEFLNEIMREKERFKCSSLANIYINGELFLPACRGQETKNCPRCRILR